MLNSLFSVPQGYYHPNQILPEIDFEGLLNHLGKDRNNLLRLFEAACDDREWLQENETNFKKVVDLLSEVEGNKKFIFDQRQKIRQICEKSLIAPHEDTLESILPDVYEKVLSFKSALQILLREDVDAFSPLKMKSREYICKRTGNSILQKENNVIEFVITKSNRRTRSFLNIISKIEEHEKDRVVVHLNPPEDIDSQSLEVLFRKYGKYADIVTFKNNTENQIQINELFKHLTQVSRLSIKSDLILDIPNLPEPDLLTELDCSSCWNLQCLPEEYVNLSTLNCSGCCNLRSLPQEYENLSTLDCSGCYRLESLPKEYTNLTTLDCSLTNIKEVPSEYMALTKLDFRYCDFLSLSSKYNLLLAIYQIDRQRSLKLISSLDIKEADLIVYSYFFDHDPEGTKVIVKYFEKMDTEKLLSLIGDESISPLIEELEVDLLQKLFIYNLCSNISMNINDMDRLETFLYSIIVNPMDDKLKSFYKKFYNSKEIFLPEDLSSISTLTWEQKLNYLPYLMQADSEWENMVRNIQFLEEARLGAEFNKDCYPNEASVLCLKRKGFFNGCQEHDKKGIEKVALLIQIFDWGARRLLQLNNQEIKNILKDPIGRLILEKKANDIFSYDRLVQIILAIYPPSRTENLPLYPVQIKNIGFSIGHLQITMAPLTPFYQPDAIIEELQEFNRIKNISIRYYGDRGIDEGGLGRQFLAQFIQGLLTRSKKYHFEVTVSKESGFKSYMPVNCLNPLENMSSEAIQIARREEENNWIFLGKMLGLALKMDYPIGEIFNIKFFKSIYLFKEEDLNCDGFSASNFLSNIAHEEVVDFVRDYLTEVDERFENGKKEYFQNVETILYLNDMSEIQTLAHKLNAVWCDEKLDAALNEEEIEVNVIKDLVREYWIDPYINRLELFRWIARGMSQALPFKVNEVKISNWNNLEFVAIDQLCTALHGELNVEWIKDNLKFNGEDIEKLESLEMWLHDWLEDNKDNKSALRNVMITFTGAPSLAQPITLYVDNHYTSIKANTCFHLVNIPEGITEDGFIAALDGWGHKPELHFPSP